MTIDNVVDILGIQQQLHVYARAVDSKDWDLYRSVFTEDAELDYTSAPFGIAGTVDQIVEWLGQFLPLLPWTMHYVTNIESDIIGDTAQVRAQFYNPMQFPGFDDLSYCGGYYHHTFVRTTDGWRSRQLREENIWFVNSPAQNAN